MLLTMGSLKLNAEQENLATAATVTEVTTDWRFVLPVKAS